MSQKFSIKTCEICIFFRRSLQVSEEFLGDYENHLRNIHGLVRWEGQLASRSWNIYNIYCYLEYCRREDKPVSPPCVRELEYHAINEKRHNTKKSWKRAGKPRSQSFCYWGDHTEKPQIFITASGSSRSFDSENHRAQLSTCEFSPKQLTRSRKNQSHSSSNQWCSHISSCFTWIDLLELVLCVARGPKVSVSSMQLCFVYRLCFTYTKELNNLAQWYSVIRRIGKWNIHKHKDRRMAEWNLDEGKDEKGSSWTRHSWIWERKSYSIWVSKALDSSANLDEIGETVGAKPGRWFCIY